MVLARSVWGGVAWGGRVVYVYPLLPLGGRSGRVPSGCVRGVRWWFENSRAYLYYFFMVK